MLSKFLSALAISAILVSTPANAGDKKPKIITDGYKMVNKDFVRLQPNITFILVKDKIELASIGAKMGSPATENDGDELADLVVIKKDGACRVYLIDPEKQYDPTYMGHAVMHCIYGRWHAPNDIGPRIQTAGY